MEIRPWENIFLLYHTKNEYFGQQTKGSIIFQTDYQTVKIITGSFGMTGTVNRSATI